MSFFTCQKGKTSINYNLVSWLIKFERSEKMTKFTFHDCPDAKRFEQTLQAYPNLTTPEVAESFIHFQWAYREMQRGYDQVLAHYGLSESKFIILMFLKQAHKQQLAPSEIAEKLGAARATVTKLLNKMEQDGWVKKKIDKTDKRMVNIQLLPQGEKVVTNFLPANFKSVALIFSDFSATELDQLFYLLTKIEKGTKKLNQEMESLL